MRTKNKNAVMALSPARPVIFRHHDYREFLRVWFEYLKKEKKEISLRWVAKKAQLSCAYLPLVLNGQRKLSSRALEKLGPWMDLKEEELSYLSLLRTLSDGDTSDIRKAALQRLQKFGAYQQLNTNEMEVFRYLTKWYYVAIREMAQLPDFLAEPEWISARLEGRVTIPEAREAIEFLTQNGYLKIKKNNRAEATQKELECMGGVYRLALTQFHHEMLQVASDIFTTDSKTPRRIEGYTMAFPKDKLDAVGNIISDAINSIQKLSQSQKSPDSVYHVAFMAVPLTSQGKETKKL